MTVDVRRTLLIGGIFFCASVCSAGSLYAANATPTQQSNFDRLIHALQVDDRASFLSNATDVMKKALTTQLLDSVSHDIAPHLNGGFQASLLGELKQKGCQVELWKITFTDGRDDALARVAITNNKLAGFFIQ